MSQLWSWGLASLGVACLYLISRKSTRTIGWTGALAIQGIWIIYAVVTRQWGFIASAIAYGAMYGKNLVAWRKESMWASMGSTDASPPSVAPSETTSRS